MQVAAKGRSGVSRKPCRRTLRKGKKIKPIKAIIVILAIAMIPLAFCMSREGLVDLEAQNRDVNITGASPSFEIVYPDSNSLSIIATQAELMRLGFYKGKNDGKCKELTLEAEVRYLLALMNGEKFKSIWEIPK